MAIIFELFIETRDETEIPGMLAFWDGFSTTTSDGSIFQWIASRDSPKSISLWSKALGAHGVQSFEQAKQMTECGIAFAQRLLLSPDFELARIGIEVDRYSRACIVQESLDEGEPWVPPGTIISESLWSDIGRPDDLPKFREGYYWRVYQGESVNPIDLDPELYKTWKQLPGC